MARFGIALLLLLCLVPAVVAQRPVKGPTVIPAARHDTSPPVRDLMRGIKPVRDTGRQEALEMEEPPARHIPPAFDPVVQSSRGTAQQAQIVTSYEGITQGGRLPAVVHDGILAVWLAKLEDPHRFLEIFRLSLVLT